MAKLYFKYGAMGSSKSAQALITKFNYEERGMRVWLIKPSVDTRDGADLIRSRIGLEAHAQIITPEQDIAAEYRKIGAYDVIISDEAQFFTPAQIDQLFRVAVTQNIPVICYGLRSDFQMNGFPGSTRLLELAHSIEELKTICSCGKKAMINARLVNGEYVFEGAQVAIDGEASVEYRSVCPECYFRLRAEHRKKQQ